MWWLLSRINNSLNEYVPLMSNGRLDFEGDAMRRGRELEPIVLTMEENSD